jgi:hypothetical protein
MNTCSNCGTELAQGEVNCCYLCDTASPLGKSLRHDRFLNPSNPPALPVKKPHFNVLDTLPSTPERKLLLELSSGKQLNVARLMLFPEPDIRQFMSLKAKAQQELGGFSTGIGFWGSPEWAIGGAAALGLIESLVSNAKAKQGLKTLSEAAQAQARMKTLGVFFDIHAIAGIWQPDPSAWRAAHESGDPAPDTVAYIHSGDEFIWVESEGQPNAVRWASVECYHLA